MNSLTLGYLRAFDSHPDEEGIETPPLFPKIGARAPTALIPTLMKKGLRLPNILTRQVQYKFPLIPTLMKKGLRRLETFHRAGEVRDGL